MRGDPPDSLIPPGRSLPHSVDAERAILGAILINNAAFRRCEGLRAEHFALAEHRETWRIIEALIGGGGVADAITVRPRLNGIVPDKVAFLFGLAEAGVMPINAGEYARLVREDADRRLLLEIADRAFNPNANLSEILAEIKRLAERPGAGAVGADLTDIAATSYPPLVEIVSGLICQGLTLLCAKPKVGKSWLVLDIALARAAGGYAAGSLQCTKGKTLALMLEDSNRRLKGRVGTLMDTRDVPRGVTVFTKWPRGDDGIAALVAWLKVHDDVDLVVIDTLAKFSGPSDPKGGGSLYQSDYERLNAIQELAQERNIAVIVLHHLRKADVGTTHSTSYPEPSA